MENLHKLLSKSSVDEINNLAKLLKADHNINSIINTLIEESTDYTTYTVIKSYKTVLISVCENLKIEIKSNLGCSELEIEIAKHILKSTIENLSIDDKNKLENQVLSFSDENGLSSSLLKSGGIAALLGSANLSGFGVYLLASTSFGVTSSFLGISIPFVAYTTLSKTISILIGPLGWIGLGYYTLYQMSKPNYKKLVPAILYITSLRGKYSMENIIENGEKKIIKMGCISGNCSNGNGTYVWENGDKYKGQFVNNQMNGLGVYTWSSGLRFDGEWKNGLRQGQGTLYSNDGTTHTGIWNNGNLKTH